jgi:uncharacterized protein (TIGR03083 family)
MPPEYTSQLRANGESMARAVGRDLDAHVPSCPDWNVAKLTIHTGQHHRWVADALRGGGARPEYPPKPGLRGEELVDWFRTGWRELADLLDEMDDDTPAWSWSGDNRVGFWRRRTSLETLVHRWDAENATGDLSPLDPELAADAVDEFLFVMIRVDDPYRGTPVHVTLRASDTGHAWTLDLQDGAPPSPSRSDATHEHDNDSGIILTAPAEDLCLFMWGRYEIEKLATEGDDELVAALIKWMKE